MISSTFTLVIVFFFFYFAVPIFVNGSDDFGYTGLQGPNHWGEKYGSCVGKHQSPINIEEHYVQDVTFPPLSFDGLNLSNNYILVNNGHTAMIYTNDSERATITGGPLKSDYSFEQLHFHWGQNDREGSEDLINNHSFAMELHAVFFKKQYQSISNAINHSDGLSVLSFFFEADANDKSNPNFNLIIETLPKIEKKGVEIILSDKLRLNYILNPETSTDWLQNYYTYNGSLTTPPCFEVVTWIDFKQPLYLSHIQIAAFRGIRSSQGEKLTHNFRPVQPLSDRVVLHNFPISSNVSNSYSNLSLIFICIVTIYFQSIFFYDQQ